MRWTVSRLACDRCRATAERPPADSRDGGLAGWRCLTDWADGDHVGEAERILCPACADRFAWFMAGGPVLEEAGAMSDASDDLVVAFLIDAVWPDDAGEQPDPSRCRLCEVIHRAQGGREANGRPCRCPCHAARDYLARIGRLAEVDQHWRRPPTEAPSAD